MNPLKKWSIAGAAFTLVAGALLHFVYDWWGGPVWAAVGTVNESTWEHIKLLFWPVLLFGMVEYGVYGKHLSCFLPVKALSLLLGMATIIVLFYTYTGILGYHIPAVDIAIFGVATAATYSWAYHRLAQSNRHCPVWARAASLAVLAALVACFLLFTYSPPKIALFLDPVSGAYGIASNPLL